MCLVSEFCVQYSCKHQISRRRQEINSGKVDSSPEYQVKEYGLYSEEWLMVDKIAFALFFCILSRYFMNQVANTKNVESNILGRCLPIFLWIKRFTTLSIDSSKYFITVCDCIHSLYFLNFYWNIVALQCCASSYYTAK